MAEALSSALAPAAAFCLGGLGGYAIAGVAGEFAVSHLTASAAGRTMR